MQFNDSFLIFISDFADRSVDYRAVEIAEDIVKVQNDLSKIETWYEVCGMALNAKKTYVCCVFDLQVHLSL